MSLAAKSPSPSPSSSSDSDDFAVLLDTELELACSSDCIFSGDPSVSPTSDDDEEEKEDVLVEVQAIEQSSTKRRRVEEQHQDQGTEIRPLEVAIDDPNRSLFTLEGMQMLTELRPFVQQFLKEASNMFEMYIYTMGDKAYAIEIAKLLDPGLAKA